MRPASSPGKKRGKACSGYASAILTPLLKSRKKEEKERKKKNGISLFNRKQTLHTFWDTTQDFDTFNLLKESNSIIKEQLEVYNRTDFAEIYLFFDYDGHASIGKSDNQLDGASVDGDEIITRMLNVFNNETENGKLYVSYPMVEALWHIKNYDTFHELIAKCKGSNCKQIDHCAERLICSLEPHYKNKVSNECIPQLCNINGYSRVIMDRIIEAHLCKMNYIIHDEYSFPDEVVSQLVIFSKQIEKFISSSCPHVSVLSAFPVFLHDYFGNMNTKALIKKQSTIDRFEPQQ